MKRKDAFFRKGMLISGIITALLFFASLVVLIEFREAFLYIVAGVIVSAIIFLVFRTIYYYREDYRIKK